MDLAISANTTFCLELLIKELITKHSEVYIWAVIQWEMQTSKRRASNSHSSVVGLGSCHQESGRGDTRIAPHCPSEVAIDRGGCSLPNLLSVQTDIEMVDSPAELRVLDRAVEGGVAT